VKIARKQKLAVAKAEARKQKLAGVRNAKHYGKKTIAAGKVYTPRKALYQGVAAELQCKVEQLEKQNKSQDKTIKLALQKSCSAGDFASSAVQIAQDASKKADRGTDAQIVANYVAKRTREVEERQKSLERRMTANEKNTNTCTKIVSTVCYGAASAVISS
jgi:ClpP class serine protease